MTMYNDSKGFHLYEIFPSLNAFLSFTAAYHRDSPLTCLNIWLLSSHNNIQCTIKLEN